MTKGQNKLEYSVWRKEPTENICLDAQNTEELIDIFLPRKYNTLKVKTTEMKILI